MRNNNHSAPAAPMELSALFFVNGEKKENLCEDSYVTAAAGPNVLVGVFDGCGGSGAKVYDTYGGHTGAYLASRIASGVAYDWFQNSEAIDALEPHLVNALKCYKASSKSTSTIRSSMAKDFPTTASAAHCTVNGGQVDVHYLWCGDSRGFLLTADGLHQMTEDDVQHTTSEPDMRSDGVMTSLCSASKPFHLHDRLIHCTQPCIVFTATDGCFGYVPSPIHFEYLLLDTLLKSSSIEEWRKGMFSILKKISADDYTMCFAAFGFDDFQQLKNTYAARCADIYSRYIEAWDACTEERRQQLWLEYASAYLAF